MMIPWKMYWSNTGLNEVECISLWTIYYMDEHCKPQREGLSIQPFSNLLDHEIFHGSSIIWNTFWETKNKIKQRLESLPRQMSYFKWTSHS